MLAPTLSKPDQGALAGSKSIPAPVGGLNARDALANMPETDAIIMDNFFPQPTWVELRGGSKTIGTFGGTGETCAAYNGLTANQLFAGVVNAGVRSLYRVDNLAGGPVGAPVVGGAGATIEALTSTRFDWQQFGTASAEYLYLVNGVDFPLIYDGTNWQSVTTTSAPISLTGTSPNLLSCVASYHQRLYFLQGNSFNVWYLPIGQAGGALVQLPLAAYFPLGGYLVSIISISIDNAAGANDYIAFVSNVGEVVVFTGTDPSSTATFSLSAHFRIGRPIGTGRRCWQKVGSDAAVVCVDGVVMLSEALLTDRSQTRNEVTDKIRKSVRAAAAQFGANFGWQLQLYPMGNKLMLNVPTTENHASYAFAMNTLHSSWCTFGLIASSWNAYCFETMGDNLYFVTNGAVKQADTVTYDDDGAAITALVKPAFSYFDEPGKLKVWNMARPVFTVNGTLSVGLTLVTDFNNALPVGTVPVSQGNAAVWNVALWTTPTYWGDALIISKNWIGVGGIGYCASLVLQLTALDVSLQWQSTDYIFEEGGLL
jgi:hypothetical protein